MIIPKLALKSLLNRRFTAILTVIAIAISVTLLLSVERIRTQAKSSFANTISGTDLIVGARTGSTQLLLSSVFHIGVPTNNLAWSSYEAIKNKSGVKWAIPLSLGDAHKGHRLVGTNNAFFEHYKFASKQPLKFIEGGSFTQAFSAVVGYEVAKQHEYQLGDSIVMSHGTGHTSFSHHDDTPYQISGVLAPTGTPIDRAIYVSLAGIDIMHGVSTGVSAHEHDEHEHDKHDKHEHDEHEHEHDEHDEHLNESDDVNSFNNHEPEQISAFLLGLKSPVFSLMLQRTINQFKPEPLLAILPGIALHEIWSLMGGVEKALLVISTFVVITGLIGMLTTILTSLNERRREMAILRSVGAQPKHIFSLMISEAVLLSTVGAALGITLFYTLLYLAKPILLQQFGLYLELTILTNYEIRLISVIIAASFFIGLIPAIKAYRLSLSDGITIKI